MAVRRAWDEVVHEICHGEQSAGRIEEVHIQECDKCQPEVSIGEIAEAATHNTAAWLEYLKPLRYLLLRLEQQEKQHIQACLHQDNFQTKQFVL